MSINRKLRFDHSLEEKLAIGQRLLLFVFIPVAAIILAFSIWRTVAILQVAVEAQGTVVELIAKNGAKGSLSYSPRVRYSTRDGQTGEFVSHRASFPSLYSVGETVKVLYDPSQLAKGEINRTANLWGLSFIITFSLIFCLSLAIILGVVRKKQAARGQQYRNPEQPPAGDELKIVPDE